VIDRLRPFERTFSYRGFKVRYSRGTSIVERVKEEGAFEGEKTDTMIRELRDTIDPVVMDVGANIGLVSLDMLAAVPGARIFAFEPGPHQCQLFRTTIRENGLEQRIELSEVALGDREGSATFAVHATEHASGDGFFDTGRAGATRTIEVGVRTVDGWWIDAGRPAVRLLKIDTEGAELMVLRGGEGMIAHCRPLLFLEINAVNLRPYPYDASDILDWLQSHGYVLHTLDGEAVGNGDLERRLQETEDFVARPRED
jgi:FkbM family methyltransferase